MDNSKDPFDGRKDATEGIWGLSTEHCTCHKSSVNKPTLTRIAMLLSGLS